MLKTIRELGVKLSLAFDKSSANQADSAIKGLVSSMKSIGLQTAAAAATMFGFAEASAANAHDLELSSQQLGINTERLQELGYAAKVAANVSRDELMGSLHGVSNTLDQVRKGNVEAASSFNRLGLSSELVTNRNLKADQVMMMVANRLKDIQDPIARASIANEIFGASGAKMLPLLLKGADGIASLGAEARKTGLIFSDQSIKKQAAFQVQLNKTLEIVKHVALTIGSALIPIVGKVLNQFAAWVTANRKLIAEGLTAFIEGLTVLVPVIFQVVMAIGKAIGWFSNLVGGMKNAAKIFVVLFGAFKLAGPMFAFIKTFGGIAAIGYRVASSIGAISTLLSPLASVFGLIAQGATAFVGALLTLNPIALAIAGIVAAMAGLVYYFKDTSWMKAFFDGAMSYLIKPWNFIKEAIAPVIEYVGKLISMFDKVTGFSESLSSIGKMLGFSSGAPAGAAGTTAAAGGAAPNTNNVQAQITVNVPPGTSAKDATNIVSQGTEQGLANVLRPTRNQALGGAAY